MQSRVRLTWLVGYSATSKGAYRLYYPPTGEIIERRDVTFLPHVFYGSADDDVQIPQNTLTPSLLSPYSEEEEEIHIISSAPTTARSENLTLPPTPAPEHGGEHNQEESKYDAEENDKPAVRLQQEEESQEELRVPPPVRSQEEEERQEEPTFLPRRSQRNATIRGFRGTSHEIEAQSRADAANKNRENSKNAESSETALLNHLINNALEINMNDEDCPTHQQAMKGTEKHFWEESKASEISSQQINGTWEIGTPPPGVVIIGSRWVLRKKRDRSGNISRFKSRIVALGYQQIKGVHFHETYSPTLKFQTFRFLMAFIVYKKWEMRQLDVTTAFLIPELPEDEVIWMKAPPGVQVEPGQALRLRRTIYGLCQASRSFNKHIDNNLRKLGLTPTNADACLYTLKIDGELAAALGLFVDDILLGGRPEVCDKIVEGLTTIYKMTVSEEPEFMLGVAIDYDKQAGTLRLSQEAYFRRMLETYNMTDCKPVKTPAAVERLTKGVGVITKEEAEVMKKVPYRNAVGALMFAMIVTGLAPIWPSLPFKSQLTSKTHGWRTGKQSNVSFDM